MSGLYYNYFRDYDPSLGRHVQSDPIGLAGGLNTYVYVLNNPLFWVDPLGLTGTIVIHRPIFIPRSEVSPRPATLPRGIHIPVDPNQPPRFPEDDNCDKEYLTLDCQSPFIF